MPDSSLRFHKLNRGTTLEWAFAFRGWRRWRGKDKRIEVEPDRLEVLESEGITIAGRRLSTDVR